MAILTKLFSNKISASKFLEALRRSGSLSKRMAVLAPIEWSLFNSTISVGPKLKKAFSEAENIADKQIRITTKIRETDTKDNS
jgi:hypothetical protein